MSMASRSPFRTTTIYSADGPIFQVPEIVALQMGFVRFATNYPKVTVVKTDKVNSTLLKFVLEHCKLYVNRDIIWNPPVQNGRIPIPPADAKMLEIDELLLHDVIIAAYELDARQLFWVAVQKYADNIGSTYDEVRRMLNLRGRGTIDGVE